HFGSPPRRSRVANGVAPNEGTPGGGVTTEHRCKDCRYWYGAEDDEFGPCQVKQSRGDRRFVTFGGHLCDEPLAIAEYGVAPR
ncbi:MAG TPA: hypothetical protein VM582_08170, partial [Candidatus Thermoplasmatota archaeon]|nr:hypothetical protein [Candidatus Thermoplasmatota archaeon]